MPDLSLVVSAILVVVIIAGASRHFRNRRSAEPTSPIEPARPTEPEVAPPTPEDHPPETGSEGSGLPEESPPVLLGKFSHVDEAETARAALEAEGIPAWVEHEYGPIVSVGTWVTLWVPEEDLESARLALEDASHRLALPPEIQAQEDRMADRDRIDRGVRYLLGFAVACLVLGTFWGFVWQAGIRGYLESFAGRPNSYPLASGRLTVGAVREMAPYLELGMFGAFYLVAAVFAGLHVWARRFPVPALLSGIVIFILVQAFCSLTAMRGFFGLGGGPTGLMNRLGFLVWTVFFLTIWIVAFREARGMGRNPSSAASGRGD